MAIKILIFLAALYALLCLFAKIFAERIAFPAPQSSYTKTTMPDLLFFKLPSGKSAAAVFLKNPQAKYTVFYSHGNGEDIYEIMPILLKFYKAGFSVFAYDYLGYGLSQGKSDFKNVTQCAESAWDFLTKDLGVKECDTAVFGYSMGSAPSVHIAANRNPRALIILGGFASAFEAVLPVNFLPWSPLNNAKKIKNVKCPILIAHGTRDIVVPFRNGKKNFANANNPKRFIKLDGAGHYNAYEKYPQILPKAFFDFINNPDSEQKL